jgi:hypothetical protein
MVGEGAAAVVDYRIRYRDLDGREQLSLPKPSPADAIQHARVIELHRGTILALVGSQGEVSWKEVLAMAEAAGNPTSRSVALQFIRYLRKGSRAVHRAHPLIAGGRRNSN